MAFSDPLTLSVDGTSLTLPRTGSSPNSGAFTTPDQRYKLLVRHNAGRRVQSVARLEFADVVTNPLISGSFMPASLAATFTVNRPLTGLDAETCIDLSAALVGWLTASNLTKLVGQEI